MTTDRTRGVATARAAWGEVRHDVVKGTVSQGARTVSVASKQDPLTPGLVAVDPRAPRALVMAARGEHADPTLVLVDFARGTAELVHAFEGPGWIVGAFTPRGIIVCEQKLDDVPRFKLLVDGRVAWAIDGMQAPCVPCLLGDGFGDGLIAIVAAPTTSPVTRTGPASLCVVDATSGALSALVLVEGDRVTFEDGALVVEAPHEQVRVLLNGARVAS